MGNESNRESVSVLLVGMVDSIHFANWIDRFEEENIEFWIFASENFRGIHPKLVNLSKQNTRIKYLGPAAVPHIGKYLQFALLMCSRKSQGKYGLSGVLLTYLKIQKYDYIHCLELQHAGYLLLDTKFIPAKTKIIVTNYGSDINYFIKDPFHLKKIRELLKITGYYSAECYRDYNLAKRLGFKGRSLPCIPNSTSFPIAFLEEKKVLPQERNLILIKSYSGPFGFGTRNIQVARDILSRIEDVRVHCFSVSQKEALEYKNLAANDFRFTYSTVENPVPFQEFLEKFRISRIYVGISRSDGLGTSFLEALASGCYPIQTDTSCADELIGKGAAGKIVNSRIDDLDLVNLIIDTYYDVKTLESAQQANRIFAIEYLEQNEIIRKSLQFYDSESIKDHEVSYE